MPMIERLRITGVKYNQQLKMYKDETFEWGSSHSLTSMINSGGKGVLLQCLFQPIIPMVSWGRDGTNEVRHFFYDDKEKFRPYPIYIAIEWTLDSIPKRHLITGIAITARPSMKKEDKEDAVEVDYFTFIKEYAEHELYSVYHLPYYDAERNVVLPIQEWERMLSQDKEFHVFTNSSRDKKRYKEALTSYGIFEEDWRELVKMNRNEAGVQDYFERVHPNSRTNFGLFRDMIIPTIANQVLQETAGHADLAQMFKDAAIIAEHLPFLKSREEAYRLLIEWSGMLEQDLLAYQVAEQELHKSERHGRQLFRSLEVLLDQSRQQQTHWSEELKRLDEWKKDLDWQQKNANYVRALRTEQNNLKSLQEAETYHHEAQEELGKRKESLRHAKRNVLRKIRDQYWTKLVELDSSIKAIEQSEAFRGNQKKLLEWEEKAKNQWVTLFKELQEVVESYAAYRAYLLETKENSRSQARKAHEDLLQSRQILQQAKMWLDTFESKAQRMVDQYGYGIRFNPVPFVESADAQEKEKRLKIHQLKESIHELEAKIMDLRTNEAQHNVKLERLSSDVTNTYQDYESQLGKEQELSAELCRLLHMEPGSDIPVPDFLRSRQTLLEDKVQYWNDRGSALKKELWAIQQELDLDVHVSEGEVWVPNKTLADAKSKLEQKGYRIFSGTEYLRDKDETERPILLQSFPLLPYSLIAMQRDIDAILRQDIFRNDVHFAPVPLYAAERLADREVHLFHIAPNVGEQLAVDPQAWIKRKEELQRNRQAVTEQIQQCTKWENQHRSLLERIRNVLFSTHSTLLFRTYEKLEVERKRAAQDLESLRAELGEQLQEIETSKSLQKEFEAQIETDIAHLKELQSFAVDFQEQDQWRHEEATAALQEKKLVNKIKQYEEDENQAEQSLTSWAPAYAKWEYEMGRVVETVQSYVPTAVFPHPSSVCSRPSEPILECSTQPIMETVYKMNALQQEMDKNHAHLARLKVERDGVKENRKTAERNLTDFDPHWEDHSSPRETEEILKHQEKVSEDELEKAIQKERLLELALVAAKKDLENSIKERQKQEKLAGRVDPWEGIDIEKKEADIMSGQEEQNKQYLAAKNKLDQLVELLNNLSSLHNVLRHTIGTDGVGLPYDVTLMEKLRANGDAVVAEWMKLRKSKDESAKAARKRAEDLIRKHMQMIDKTSWDKILKKEVLDQYRSMDVLQVEDTLEIMAEIRRYSLFELERQQEEIGVSEKARSDWSKHAAKFCIQVIDNMRKMTHQMTIKSNRGGHRFELVRLRNAERLPKLVEDVETQIQEFFDKTLMDLLHSYRSMEEIDFKVVEKKVNASDLVYAALQQSIPILDIYNLNTDNSFLTEPPLSKYYDSWETMNTGSYTKTAGSGGQLVAARTLITMMLMTFKRQSTDRHRAVLISDNPFANAISPHVIDPIFVIADLLQFQWIVVTPTELVKLEISEKFKVYCSLDLEKQTSGKDVVIQQVHHGFRQLEQAPRLI